MHLVDELTQCVERLVPRVGTDPLERLHLVEDDEETGVPGVAQHGEQALQEAQRPEVVQVAAYACGPAGRGGDVRLAAEPCQHSRGGRLVAVGEGGPVAAQGGGEGWGVPGHLCEPRDEQLLHLAGQLLLGRAGERERPPPRRRTRHRPLAAGRWAGSWRW